MTSEAEKLIHAVETADSSKRLINAVEDLAEARLEAGLPTLIAVLGYNNPGAAVAAVDGLVRLGEAAVKPLLELLDNYNYGARAWAIRALAGIGDPRGFEVLLEAAKNDFALSVRRAAARGLGILRWHRLAADRVAGVQAVALDTLTQIAQTDAEWVVRYAAVTGIEALATAASQPHLTTQAATELKQLASADADLTVRTRAHLALKRVDQFISSR
jgi:phycocyanobilin lyase beta subunit